MTQTTFDRKWLAGLFLFSTFLLAVFIAAYLRLIPTKLASIPFYDTLGHLILYGMLAALIHFAVRGRNLLVPCTRLSLPVAVIITIGLALLDELLQNLSPYRSADMSDLAADVIGIVISVSIANGLTKTTSRKI